MSKSSTKNPRFALIEWVGGEDSGKYTPGVPTDWIKDFNYDEFLSTHSDEQESYVVEWHDGKKPLGGWNCYDGKVIQVSDHRAVLDRLFKTLKCTASPNHKINHEALSIDKAGRTEPVSDNSDDSVFDRASSSNSYSEKNFPKKSRISKSTVDSEAVIAHESDHRNDSVSGKSRPTDKYAKKNEHRGGSDWAEMKKLKVRPIVESEDDEATDQLLSEVGIRATPANKVTLQHKQLLMETADRTSEDDSDVERQNAQKRPKYSNKPLENLKRHQDDRILKRKSDNSVIEQPAQKENQPSPIDMIMNTLGVMQQQIDKLARKENVPINVNVSSVDSNDENDEERDEMNKDVEIGRKGSGVIVKKGQWQQAIAQPTVTSMATCLLDAVFPYEILVTSNLRGGACKIKPGVGGKEQKRHRPLDPKILKEIYDTVQRYHKKKFHAALVGKAINDHLHYLRTQKKVNDQLEETLNRVSQERQSKETPHRLMEN